MLLFWRRCTSLTAIRGSRYCVRCLYSTKSSESADYFITTPIFYVNAAPHIGHLYSAVVADAAHSFQRLLSKKTTIFSTGTDEHGLKVQQAAASMKRDPAVYCDEVSEKYKELFEKCHVGYTDFIRTTDERHKTAVNSFWEKLLERGHIYKSQYEGWYCVADETFLTNIQLEVVPSTNGEVTRVSAETGNPVEWISEENYMFRLSAFQGDLLHWLQDETVIEPAKFHKVLTAWIMDGILDLSISRPSSRLSWGIPVPGDSTQTVYVWLDALINYLSVGGFPSKQHIWPADCHVIGKDILKFHGIYWPAFLIAAGLEPPRKVLCHSHWTVDGQKMSKSKGNVIDPFEKIKKYTASGLRYFLLRESVPHSDGNYSESKILKILNAELADTMGNLLGRCSAPGLNVQQVFPAYCPESFQQYCSAQGWELMRSVSQLPGFVREKYIHFNFDKGIDAVIATLRLTNKLLQDERPWELKKSGNVEHLHVILHITLETLRVCGILLYPIIPELCDMLLNKLNIPVRERQWTYLHPLSWDETQQRRETRPLNQEKITLFKRLKES